MQLLGSPTSGLGLGMDTTCASLLRQLQHAWDEIGETEADKDRMLLELERDCLKVYQRKVDEASDAKTHLHQSVAAKKAELATLVAVLGDLNIHPQFQTGKFQTSLKEQLASITPVLEDLRTTKETRIKLFADVRTQIEKTSGEISGSHRASDAMISATNMEDLSLRKLNEYQMHLSTIQKEKSDRLHKVLGYMNEIHTLCEVLGLDFRKTVNEVHPSLQEAHHGQSTNISDSTLEGLEQAIVKLKLERKTRMQKLTEILLSLYELWNLMDSPEEDRRRFRKFTFILESAAPEVTKADILSLENIDQVAKEVERLNELKASRMKELVLIKRLELEEICKKAHLEPDMSTALEKSKALIDSGLVDPSGLLSNIEAQIAKAKDEAENRKEIMEKIDRWLVACEEESWLEDYNQDDNRYSAGRGAHINLKRAERARVTVNKIPAIVENLMNKTVAWENERKMFFFYDGVRLVSLLEDYKLTRQQREEEKKRYRDQKKLQDLLLTEKESIYGSKPSPKRSNNFRNTNGYRANGNGSATLTPRRNSVGCGTPELLTPRYRSGQQNGHFKEMRRLSTVPLNFVSMRKEDTMSYASVCGSEPGSPPSQGTSN